MAMLCAADYLSAADSRDEWVAAGPSGEISPNGILSANLDGFRVYSKISEFKTARALTAGALDCYCMGMVSIQSKGPTW